MGSCKFCGGEIVFAWHELWARWVPCDPESITGDEQVHERGLLFESHLRRHRCASSSSGPKSAHRGHHSAGHPEAPTRGSSAHATLFVTPDAPMEVIRAAYKALAMLYHPDLGGDPNAMVALNQAYETLLEKN